MHQSSNFSKLSAKEISILKIILRKIEAFPSEDAEGDPAREVNSDIGSDRLMRMDEAALSEARKRFSMLTPRQKQVAVLVTNGLSSKEIARKLGVSHRTIEVFRQGAMERMGVTNTVIFARLISAIA